jgi:lycopene cyclase domain-containing protein
MMPIYFYVLLVSIIVPLWFTIFKIDFIKNWKNFGISTTLIAVVFIIWDVIFTNVEIWGFNDKYCLGIYFLKIPLEEWLFFLIIPFCSLFTHFAFFYAFPNLRLNRKTTLYVSVLLIALSTILIVTNLSKAYTVVNFSFLLIVLLFGIIYNLKLLQQFYMSFLIILIPFFIVNGILTGAITDTPIVWYNHLENLGIRLHTIPVEDIGYAFSMLFGNLMIFERLNKQ